MAKTIATPQSENLYNGLLQFFKNEVKYNVCIALLIAHELNDLISSVIGLFNYIRNINGMLEPFLFMKELHIILLSIYC